MPAYINDDTLSIDDADQWVGLHIFATLAQCIMPMTSIRHIAIGGTLQAGQRLQNILQFVDRLIQNEYLFSINVGCPISIMDVEYLTQRLVQRRIPLDNLVLSLPTPYARSLPLLQFLSGKVKALVLDAPNLTDAELDAYWFAHCHGVNRFDEIRIFNSILTQSRLDQLPNSRFYNHDRVLSPPIGQG